MGCLVGGSCMNWGHEDRGRWRLLGRERLSLRGRERRERSGVCRRGLNWPRPQGMRWAESTLDLEALPSWAGPNGQRKPPLARCQASPSLQKRRRDVAYGTVLFVPGPLLNSYHTFHMCTSASHCPLLSAPPRLSGCAFITSVVSTRLPLFGSFLPAGPTRPFRPGFSSTHEPTGIEGVETGRAVGGATLRSVRAREAVLANGVTSLREAGRGEGSVGPA